MSWSSRFGNLGRFSPFTRSPPQGSSKVSDDDFSYITDADLRNIKDGSLDQRLESNETPEDLGPARETDVLRIHYKRNDYSIHFAAYSIGKGDLTIGQVRNQVAKKINVSDPRRVKLLYRGKNLKDDSKTCRQEGLRHDVELMCSLGDNVAADDSDDDEEDDDFADHTNSENAGEPKKRRNRGKKTKRRNKREERDAASGTSTPVSEHLGVPPSVQPQRAPSPKPQTSVPVTPLDKLNALHQTLQNFIPDVNAFVRSPPSDPAKREYEHKKLTETIFMQVQLKIDAVETEGDVDARARRKELVKETQNVLQDLDAALKA